MHTRRFGAFLIGMWLMGSILVWYTLSQGQLTIERLFADPPQQLRRELAETGLAPARQLLQYQTGEMNRRIQQTWEIIQLGLLGALLAISVLNAHRSSIIIGSALLMTALVFLQTLAITPGMNSAGKALDFLPLDLAALERQSFAVYARWYTVLDTVKTVLALILVTRLTFDFYDFSSAKNSSRRRHRSGTPVSVAGSLPSDEGD